MFPVVDNRLPNRFRFCEGVRQGIFCMVIGYLICMIQIGICEFTFGHVLFLYRGAPGCSQKNGCKKQECRDNRHPPEVFHQTFITGGCIYPYLNIFVEYKLVSSSPDDLHRSDVRF